MALGKEMLQKFYFFKKTLCRGQWDGPRQRTLLCRGPWSLLSAKRQNFKFLFCFLHSIDTSISYIYINHHIYIYMTQNPFSHNILQRQVTCSSSFTCLLRQVHEIQAQVRTINHKYYNKVQPHHLTLVLKMPSSDHKYIQ